MKLPPDPFGRTRLPTAVAAAGRDRYSREHRVRLVGQAAQDLVALAHQLPHPQAALFVGAAIEAWLRTGGALGSLERDFLQITGPARSRLTPSRLWARCASTATSTGDDGTMPSIRNNQLETP